jgi:hypothetical protein
MRVMNAVLVLALATGCGSEREQMLLWRAQRFRHVRAMIAPLIASSKTLPMKDGALDVYALARTGVIRPDSYAIFQSEHGLPRDGEIERGDYRDFPYERYRGNGVLDGRYPIPLIWDKEPDAGGLLIVGMSDGAVRTMYRAEFKREFGG